MLSDDYEISLFNGIIKWKPFASLAALMYLMIGFVLGRLWN
jgi:hypothetical protein